MAVNVQRMVKRIEKLGEAPAKANKAATTKAALAYKDATLDQGRKAVGSDLRLSRWGRKGVKINVGFDVDDSGGRSVATVKPRPLGVWKVLEYGAEPHLIVPGLTRRQRKAMSLFSAMAGGRGDYNVAELAATARGNRNNRSGSRRKKRRVPLKIGGNVRAWARHPGTSPKRTWSKGIAGGTDDALDAYKRAQSEALVKAFK